MEYWSLITIFITTLLLVLFVKIKKAYQYFENCNAPYVKPTFILGSTYKAFAFKENFEDSLDKIYNQLKNHKVGGFFQLWSPTWIVNDPDLIDKILIKDFSHFQDHQGELNLELNPLDGNLFNLKGQHWKTIRTKLSPIFSSGKIKWMMEQILKCGDDLIIRLDNTREKDIPIKDSLQSYGLDVIGSCAFGIDTESFKDPNSKFLQMVDKVLSPPMLQVLKFIMRLFFAKFFRFLNLKTFSQDVTDFFVNMTKYSIDERIKNGVTRKDFVQLLAQLKEKGYVEYEDNDLNEKQEDNKYEFTYEVLAAQTFIFFLAGLDTSSTMIMYTLYLLSKHPEIQEKMRDEIQKNVQNDITYESLQKLTYVDCVLSESLRLFPPTLIIIRECTKTYTVDNITIPEGDTVLIPVKSLQMNPDYFPEPDQFKPERFLDSRYSTRQGFGVYLPFGDGPRVCIARRFALLMAKIAIVKIMQKYKLLHSDKNIEPLKRNPISLTNKPVGGLFIRLEQIAK